MSLKNRIGKIEASQPVIDPLYELLELVKSSIRSKIYVELEKMTKKSCLSSPPTCREDVINELRRNATKTNWHLQPVRTLTELEKMDEANE